MGLPLNTKCPFLGEIEASAANFAKGGHLAELSRPKTQSYVRESAKSNRPCAVRAWAKSIMWPSNTTAE